MGFKEAVPSASLADSGPVDPELGGCGHSQGLRSPAQRAGGPLRTGCSMTRAKCRSWHQRSWVAAPSVQGLTHSRSQDANVRLAIYREPLVPRFMLGLYIYFIERNFSLIVHKNPMGKEETEAKRSEITLQTTWPVRSGWQDSRPVCLTPGSAN